jgi:hypothetical protein
MRRVSSWALVIVVVLGVVAEGTPAQAGGSTFSFHNRWFAPGQTAVSKTQFSDWAGAQGRVAEGPYFAYLVRGDRFIEPPQLPHNAVRLGQVTMLRVEGTIWEASIRFVVPRVRPGGHLVSLCNDPCRSTSVGDLVGARISIAATAEQAKMRNLEARIRERVAQDVSETISSLQQQLDAATPPSGITVGTEMRLAPIEDELKTMAAQVRDLRQPGDQGLLAWLWLSGWVVAAGMAILWRRTTARRRPSANAMPTSEGVTWMEATPPSDSEDGRWGAPISAGELVSR